MLALAALVTAIVNHVEPVSCLVRGAAAFVAGKVLFSVWCVLFPDGTVGQQGAPEVGPPVESRDIGEDKVAA